jgi:Mg-chelatase subunit ChlD
VIIPYGTIIPAEKQRDDFTVGSVGQIHFDVPIVEFDNMGPDVILKTCRFLCKPNTPSRSRIAICFKYDRSGEVNVEARNARTGETLDKQTVDYVEPDLSQFKLTRKPRRVIFLLDVSGSMGGEKLRRAKDALTSVAISVLGQSSRPTKVGIATFSSTAVRMCELTDNISEVKSAVASMSASGSTRMDQGIRTAAEMFNGVETDCQREIALVTDGMPDSTDFALRAARIATDAGIKLSAVGIGSEEVDENFLHQIASGVLMIDNIDELAGALPDLLMKSDRTSDIALAWGST